MKKLLFIIPIILFIIPITSFAQTSFSAEYREVCNWRPSDSKWEKKCNGGEDNSLFVMNEDLTMMTHTTSNLTSTYYVQEHRSSQEDIDNYLFTYDVISDVGNEYYLIIDGKHDEIKMVSTNGEESTWFMTRWYIKAIF
tara:strand:- start:4 stop:420 length:417 start_codon:yes stop_codon:yes gene_type:complete